VDYGGWLKTWEIPAGSQLARAHAQRKGVLRGIRGASNHLITIKVQLPQSQQP